MHILPGWQSLSIVHATQLPPEHRLPAPTCAQSMSVVQRVTHLPATQLIVPVSQPHCFW